jgi:peptidoglycan/xylan/chitin deacetylase (PgdA/CDA1 family)
LVPGESSIARRRTRRRARRRNRRLLVGAAALVLAGALAGAWSAASAGRSTISIKVAGRAAGVPTRATLTEAAQRYGLKPRAGNLLDVEGRVLRAGRFPGRLLVNGRPAPGGTVLRAGDRVGVRNGADRPEPLEREVAQITARRPANPQFYVDLVPGKSIVVRGAVSHQLVSARFVPDGPAVPDRAVALTFDDGPSAYTRRVLAVLMRLHVPATFFVIGNQAEANPDLIRLEVDSGMIVANHSYDHPWRSPFAELPHTQIRSEVRHGEAGQNRLGVRSVLFRPPGGTYSPFVLRTALEGGQRVVLWSVDARDWVAGTTTEQVVQRVLGAVGPGSIVLMHDGGGDRSATLEALSTIIDAIRERGLRFVTLAPTG